VRSNQGPAGGDHERCCTMRQPFASIDAGPPSAVPSLPGRFDVELRQINAAAMMELARRHPQQMPKAVIDRAMPLSELKAA
jgi:hypothetical protein